MSGVVKAVGEDDVAMFILLKFVAAAHLLDFDGLAR